MELIYAAFLGALMALPSNAVAQTINVDVVTYPNQSWRINRLHASETESGWTIRGRLNAYRVSSPPAGHIDVAAYTQDGQLLAETTTAYSPAILTPKLRKKGGLRFSTTFDREFPEGTVVKVAFHPSEKPPAGEAKPLHNANIAR